MKMNYTTNYLGKILQIRDFAYSGRVDRFLSTILVGWSRSMVDQLIEAKAVLLNDILLKKGSKDIDSGDTVYIDKDIFERVDNRLSKELRLKTFGDHGESGIILPEDIVLDVVFEDEDVLIINKNAGIAVHPGAGNFSGTLVNAVAGYFEKKGLKRPHRVGMVHRLDKDVRGLILFAKNDKALSLLSKQFSGEGIEPRGMDNGKRLDLSLKALKMYTAIVGPFKNKTFLQKLFPVSNWITVEGYLDRSNRDRRTFEFKPNVNYGYETSASSYNIANLFKDENNSQVNEKGRYALSFMRLESYLLDKDLFYGVLKVHIVTGRTHQIRAQLAGLDMPILGDSLYGGTPYSKGVMLQSTCLSYIPIGVYNMFAGKTPYGAVSKDGAEGDGSKKGGEATLSQYEYRYLSRDAELDFGGFWNKTIDRNTICLSSLATLFDIK